MFVRCGFYAIFKCQLTHNHHRYLKSAKTKWYTFTPFYIQAIYKIWWSEVRYQNVWTECLFLNFYFLTGIACKHKWKWIPKTITFSAKLFSMVFFGVFPTAFLLTQKLFIVHSLILNTMNIYWMINENVINFISYISLLICPIKIRFQKFKYYTSTQCNRTRVIHQ